MAHDGDIGIVEIGFVQVGAVVGEDEPLVAQLEVEALGQRLGPQTLVDVATHGVDHRPEAGQIVQDLGLSNVARVQDGIDTRQRVVYLWSNEAVCVRDQPNHHGCMLMQEKRRSTRSSVLLDEQRRVRYLEKPAGITVFPPHSDSGGDCLLRRYAAEVDLTHEFPRGFEGGIAHRLDVPTSGLVLAAVTADDLAWLRDLFEAGDLDKTYVFVSNKEVPWDSHTITARLAHDRKKRARMVVERGRNTPHRGRWYEAETELVRLGRVGSRAMWRARIRTGVTHQIRVHAAFAGLALAGDRLYGGGDGDPAWPVPFLLHHLQTRGPGLTSPVCPLPDHWPASAMGLLLNHPA